MAQESGNTMPILLKNTWLVGGRVGLALRSSGR